MGGSVSWKNVAFVRALGGRFLRSRRTQYLLDCVTRGVRPALVADLFSERNRRVRHPRIRQQQPELAGRGIGIEVFSRNGARDAETRAACRVVELIVREWHDEHRPSRAQRLSRGANAT